MNDNIGRVGGREIAIETMTVVAALAVVVGAVYFWDYAHGIDMSGNAVIKSAQQRLSDSRPTPAQLAASLQAAQVKLAKQSAVLAAMKAGFPSSPKLDKQITDAYAAAAAAIAKTDKLFNAPDSDDPALKNAGADPARAAAIVGLRREINADLAGWKAASAGAGSTLLLSQAALADLGIMQTYLNQLQSYLAALPPSTALQSDVIIADQGQIAEAAAVVNDAINSVESVGAPPIAATIAVDSGSNADASQGRSAGGSAAPENSSPSSPPAGQSSAAPAVVTVGDVLSAQAAIGETSNQIQSIQQQITDYNVMPSSPSDSGNSGSNAGQSSGDNSILNPSTPDSNWNPDYNGDSNLNGNAGFNGNGSDQSWMQFIPPEDQNSTGPRLIQGENPFQ